MVVLQNHDLENREKLFEQFEAECENTFVEDGDAKIPVSVARGITLFDSEKDSNFADVFKRADDAMYENKSKIKATLG